MEPPSRSDQSPEPSKPDKGKRSHKEKKARKRLRRRFERLAERQSGRQSEQQAGQQPGHAAAGVSRHAAERRRTEPSGGVEIFVVDLRWHRLVPHVERLVRRAAQEAGGAGSVVLDNDLRLRRLNARHRGRNKPTNVLTFETPPGIPGGDIVVALETVRREAHAAGRRVRHHLAHLVVHGALHLRGHDHHGVGETRRMEMQEARILHRLGVPNPWKPSGASRPDQLR